MQEKHWEKVRILVAAEVKLTIDTLTNVYVVKISTQKFLKPARTWSMALSEAEKP